MKAASVPDYRRLAKKRLPHFLFEYLDGGSYAEVTKERNRTDLEAIALRQRVLRDVSDIDTRSRLIAVTSSFNEKGGNCRTEFDSRPTERDFWRTNGQGLVGETRRPLRSSLHFT